LPHELALSALRLTLGQQTTASDIDTVLAKLPGVIEKLREFQQR